MIYVDATQEYPPQMVKPGARHAGTKWCHLWSSDNDVRELIEFGNRIKLRPGWLQRTRSVVLQADWVHFDITPSRRRAAVINGAMEKDLKDWLTEQYGMRHIA